MNNIYIYIQAFNTVTGPKHYGLLNRSRACDLQSYIISASPARNLDASYHAYGHSQVVSPWGKVLKEATEKEEIFVCDIDLDEVKTVRESIPISYQKREDVYSLVKKL